MDAVTPATLTGHDNDNDNSDEDSTHDIDGPSSYNGTLPSIAPPS
jgi:hypothetical protein